LREIELKKLEEKVKEVEHKLEHKAELGEKA